MCSNSIKPALLMEFQLALLGQYYQTKKKDYRGRRMGRMIAIEQATRMFKKKLRSDVPPEMPKHNLEF